MAAKTPTIVNSVKGFFNSFYFDNLDDGDEWTGPASGVYWFQATNNPSTQGDTGCNIVRSGTTYTFYPAVDDLTGYLFIENRE